MFTDKMIINSKSAMRLDVALSCRYIDSNKPYSANDAIKFIKSSTGYVNIVHTRVGSQLDTFSIIGKRANVFVKVMHKGHNASYVECMFLEGEEV